MNALQFLVYYTLKVLVIIQFNIYYSKTLTLGKKYLRLSKPTIVVSNHPSTLMDILNVGRKIKAPLYFLANAGMFKGRFAGPFFRFLFCIPVERPYDTGGKPINNETSFLKSYEHLEKGLHIYIAPEGGSYTGRKLLPLKTGAVRIALGTEARNQFQRGVQILPVGLTYSSLQDTFRSEVVIHVGEPIDMTTFAQAYAQDERQTVREVTDLLHTRMRELLVATQDEHQDQLLYQLEEILRYQEDSTQEVAYFRSRKLVSALQQWQQSEPTAYESFLTQVAAYFQTLNEQQITEQSLADTALNKIGLWMRIGVLLFSAPYAAYGFINNALAFGVPYFLSKRMKLIIEYKSTVEAMLGLIFVPFFYALQTWVLSFFLAPLWCWAYLISLPLTAWNAWMWLLVSKEAASLLLLRTKKDLTQHLLIQRSSILDQVKKLLG